MSKNQGFHLENVRRKHILEEKDLASNFRHVSVSVFFSAVLTDTACSVYPLGLVF